MDKTNFTLYYTWAKYNVHISAYDRSHVALIAQLGEHCTGIAEVVGSNRAQSLKTKLISLPGLFARRLKTCIMDRVFDVLFLLL